MSARLVVRSYSVKGYRGYITTRRLVGAILTKKRKKERTTTLSLKYTQIGREMVMEINNNKFRRGVQEADRPSNNMATGAEKNKQRPP